MKLASMTKSICCFILIFASFLECGLAQFDRFHPPIVSSNGNKVDAWKGGFTAPQVSTMDFNFDGLEDVVIFDRNGSVLLPYVQTDAGLEYGLQYDARFARSFPDIRSWMLLRDYDGDGIKDLFCHSVIVGIPGISVYRGSNVDGRLEFELQTFGGNFPEILQIPSGNSTTNIYVSEDDIPAIEDFDGDGDVDLASFESNGSYIYYYRNYAVENTGKSNTFIMDLDDACWGKVLESDFSEDIILSSNPGVCTSNLGTTEIEERHAGSTLMAMDYDDDGLMEMVVGDLAYGSLTLLDNQGSAEEAFVTGLISNFPENSVSVDIPFFVASFYADVDQDGRRDLLAAPNSSGSSETIDVLWYYKNVGTDDAPQFSFEQRDMFVENVLDFGLDAAPCFVDYNADGLQDLVVGTSGTRNADGNRNLRLILLENVGTALAPAFTVADEDYLGFSQFFPSAFALKPSFGDLDGDGDLDIVVGKQDGTLIYGENVAGVGVPIDIPALVDDFMGIDVGNFAAPTIGDINQDGLGDMIIGERNGNVDSEGNACSVLNYFENQGSTGNAFFVSAADEFPNTACAGGVFLERSDLFSFGSSPYFSEFEDGTTLLFVGSDNGKVSVYQDIRETIYGEFEVLDDFWGGVDEGFRTHPAVADIRDDGRLDLIVGNNRGGLSAFRSDIDADGNIVNTENLLSGIQLDLFPNPSSGQVHIASSEPFRFQVFSSDGVLVLQEENFNMQSELFLTSGVFFVRIEDVRGHSMVKRCVVLR